MKSFSELIHNYILAKDGNRPHLMKHAFAENAILEMVVKTGSISFPPLSRGIDSIIDVLVRRFGQTYENVYTLCLANPPKESDDSFSCKWLVVMSEKESGVVRVGCGNVCPVKVVTNNMPRVDGIQAVINYIRSDADS